MDWNYWLFPDMAAYRGLKKLDGRLSAGLRRQRARNSSLEQRVEVLERDLARTTMLARALAELGLAKGAFTVEDLERALVEADLADGVRDQGLAGDAALPPEQRFAELEPLDGEGGEGGEGGERA